eukprot:2726785-Pleurochrysis_carterae.AAC.1
MSPGDATACMHARLHAGATCLHNLPSITADAPASLANGRFDGCAACTEKNATRHAHNTTQYKLSHAGRLIHADIAGPFARTQHTGLPVLARSCRRSHALQGRTLPKRQVRGTRSCPSIHEL